MPRLRNAALVVGLGGATAVFACNEGENGVGAPIPVQDAGRESGFVVGDSSSSGNVPSKDAGPPVHSQVAVGAGFACVLAKDRTVSCWGRNDLGQLGRDEAATPSCGAFPCSPTPTKVEGLGDVARIVAGDEFACALDRAGTVSCWGSNAKGQLATPEVTKSFTPRTTIVNVIDIAASGSHACAITSASLVYCWGENACEIFGKTEPGIPYGARQVPNLPLMAQISLGPDAMCSTKPDGRVLCWGADHRGSLGHDLDPAAPQCNGVPFDPVPKSVQIADSEIPITLVSDVHIGAGVACARHTNGKVACWGDNQRGALGLGVPDTASHPRAADVPAMFAEKLEVSGQTPCVIAADRLLCWGDGQFGQLDALSPDSGCGGKGCRALAYPITGMMGVRDVSTGPGSIAAIKDDLTLWMWGRNNSGELAIPQSDPNNTPCQGGICIPRPQQLMNAPQLD